MSASLEAQIASLRTDLARTRRLYGLTLLAFAAVGLVAAARPVEVVRAQRFEVVDADGDVRAVLEGTEDSADLHLYGGGGESIWLSAFDGRSGLFMRTAGWQRAGAGAAMWANGSGSRLQLGDELGISRVTAGTGGDSQWVRVIDPSGIVRAEIGGDTDREQRLFVGDPHGGPSLSLTADTEGTSVDLGD